MLDDLRWIELRDDECAPLRVQGGGFGPENLKLSATLSSRLLGWADEASAAAEGETTFQRPGRRFLSNKLQHDGAAIAQAVADEKRR